VSDCSDVIFSGGRFEDLPGATHLQSPLCLFNRPTQVFCVDAGSVHFWQLACLRLHPSALLTLLLGAFFQFALGAACFELQAQQSRAHFVLQFLIARSETSLGLVNCWLRRHADKAGAFCVTCTLIIDGGAGPVRIVFQSEAVVGIV